MCLVDNTQAYCEDTHLLTVADVATVASGPGRCSRRLHHRSMVTPSSSRSIIRNLMKLNGCYLARSRQCHAPVVYLVPRVRIRQIHENISSISSRCALFALARLFCLGSSEAVPRLFTTTAGCEEGPRVKVGDTVGGTSVTATYKGRE